MSKRYGTFLYMAIAPEPAGGSAIGGYKHGRVPRELREQQMLDVAEEVFTEHGYDGASIEEICRRAGLKRPLFYTYFGGKEGLYLACYRRARSELDERLATAGTAEGVQPATPEAFRQTVEPIVRAYFDFLAASPSRWRKYKLSRRETARRATSSPMTSSSICIRFLSSANRRP